MVYFCDIKRGEGWGSKVDITMILIFPKIVWKCPLISGGLVYMHVYQYDVPVLKRKLCSTIEIDSTLGTCTLHFFKVPIMHALDFSQFVIIHTNLR